MARAVTGISGFGRIDHVPGVCYVETRFLHFGFFPLIPLESEIVLEARPDRGKGISISLRSIAFAWLRAIAVFGAAIAFFGGVAYYADRERTGLYTIGIGLAAALPGAVTF